jgi:uncharacterized protein (DUF983 family)
MENSISMREASRRAILGKCPCCGEGRLFRSYLKQVDNCSVCGEAFGAIRADDAAPWLTIIIVGHLFLPLMLYFETGTSVPAWVAACGWSAFFIGLSLAILPRAKGLFIAILWQTKAAPGVLRAPVSKA